MRNFEVMRTSALSLVLLLGLACFAQTDSTAKSDSTSDKEVPMFYTVSERAEFPGGDMAFQKYLTDNLEYPEDAVENGIEGKVYIQFDIDRDGNVTDVKIVKMDLYQEVEVPTGKRRKTKTVRTKLDSSNDYCLGTCASNLIANSPKWKPAKQRNKPVKMRFVMPIKYEVF